MLSNLVKERISGLIGFVSEAKIKDIEQSWEDYFDAYKITDEEKQLDEFDLVMKKRISNFSFKAQSEPTPKPSKGVNSDYYLEKPKPPKGNFMTETGKIIG